MNKYITALSIDDEELCNKALSIELKNIARTSSFSAAIPTRGRYGGDQKLKAGHRLPRY